MGGAPPPPQDFAPQAPKNRKKWPVYGSFLEVCGAEDQRPKRGVGGIQATTPNRSFEGRSRPSGPHNADSPGRGRIRELVWATV